MKSILVLVLTVLIIACTTKNKNILPINTMKVVMWQLMQVDEFATFYLSKDSSKNIIAETNVLYKQIFELNKIDGHQFYNSFNWYRNSVSNYKLLLDSLGAYSMRKREERYITPTPPTTPPAVTNEK